MAALSVTFDTFTVQMFSLTYDGTSVLAFLSYFISSSVHPEVAINKSRQQVVTPSDVSTKTLATIYNAAVTAAKTAEGL